MTLLYYIFDRLFVNQQYNTGIAKSTRTYVPRTGLILEMWFLNLAIHSQLCRVPAGNTISQIV